MRVIIWSIPILGLLGTVVGITSVFANLDIKHFDASLPMVLDGMKVAFDTTGLALGLSMLLMFGQYFVDRSESGLLSEVDARMNSELMGRFASSGGGDPQLAGIRRMMEAVVQSSDRLVSRQTELWRGTIDAAEDRHRQLSVAGAKQLEIGLTAALENSLKTHAAALAAHEKGFVEQNARQWSGVQQAPHANRGRRRRSAGGTCQTIGSPAENCRSRQPDRDCWSTRSIAICRLWPPRVILTRPWWP